MEKFVRTELLIGSEGVRILNGARVAVFGLGGVGGFTAEALCRAGIGAIDVIDNDVITESNINRQLYALTSTLGQPKTSAAYARLKDINPDAEIRAVNCFFDSDSAPQFDFSVYDYVADAIDTVTSKLLLAEMCLGANVPLISCMGTGNKFDPSLFHVADVFETKTCPLARVLRRELKKRGITRLKTVCSEEQPLKPLAGCENGQLAEGRRVTPGSMSFVPPVAGMIMAGEIIKDLLSVGKTRK